MSRIHTHTLEPGPSPSAAPRLLGEKIKTSRAQYVYDTWTNEILEVDDAVFRLLPGGASEFGIESDVSTTEQHRARREIAAAKQQGYFKECYPEIESFPEEQLSGLVDAALQAGPDHIILEISERCNLRCRYCIYSGAYDFERTHGKRAMSWTVAKRTLDWYFAHRQRKDFTIGFYGGEPLTAFAMIKRVVAYARSEQGQAVKFCLTTNGTLQSAEHWKFLIDEGFRITISLDGPDWIHDRYRVYRSGRGTHKRVWQGIARLRSLDEEFFKNNVSFSMVLAPPVELEALDRFVSDHPEVFADTSLMISAVNGHSDKVLEQMGVHGAPHQREKQVQESSAVFEQFSAALRHDGQPAGFSRFYHGREFVTVHQRPMTMMPHKVPSHGQCIPGRRKCMIDTDGALYMCERVNPAYRMGDVWSGVDRDRVTDFLLAYNRFFKEQCSRCWAVRLCQKCYNNVRDGEAWSEHRGREFCAAQRARTRRVLTRYCEVRESRDDAFAWAEDIEVK